MADDNSLLQCIISRSKTLLMSILNSDVDINKRDESGRTPLHVAARKNYQEGVELLLERGADVNVHSKSGNTPLHEGINNYEIVKTLLDKGALPDCRNRGGETPLFHAVWYRNLEVVNLLLNVGVKIDMQDAFGETPLHEAVKNRSHEIVKILLAHGENIETKGKQGFTPLHIFAERNDCLSTDELCQKEFIFPTCSNTPLHIAAKSNFCSIIKVLLDRGANPNIKNKGGEAPLHISALLGDLKSVEILIQKGADVNLKARNQENTPLHLAAKGNEPLMIDVLIQGSAIVDLINIKGNTALHEAVNSMAPENVEFLLQAGANINAQNEKGETPLHLAAGKRVFGRFVRKELLKVIQILLDWGASVKLTNKKSKTVLDVARGEHLDLVKKHFVKLMPLNGSQFEVNVAIDLEGYESFHKSCLEELGRLKKKTCGQYSFLDIFYMYNYPLYVNSISIEKELSLLETEFPIYASLLKQTFRKAKKRFSVMSKLVECFSFNCLPVELKWKILTYLSDESLEYIFKIVDKC